MTIKSVGLNNKSGASIIKIKDFTLTINNRGRLNPSLKIITTSNVLQYAVE